MSTGDAQAPARAAVTPRPSYIAWTALALMTVSSVASLRPAPTMAVYGLACVFLYVLPAIVFLIPTALVSAELASGWSGGVYRWVTEGMSPNMGFAAAWHQFAMTIFCRRPSLRGRAIQHLPHPAVLPCQHTGVRHRPEPGVQRGVHRGGDHRRVLGRRHAGVARRHRGDRQAGLQRCADRHPDPRRDPGPARHR